MGAGQGGAVGEVGQGGAVGEVGQGGAVGWSEVGCRGWARRHRTG